MLLVEVPESVLLVAIFEVVNKKRLVLCFGPDN
jgi:hypothetical protein